MTSGHSRVDPTTPDPDTGWWFCLKHMQVEPAHACANAQRLGPYETHDDASQALERARERTREFDEADKKRWG